MTDLTTLTGDYFVISYRNYGGVNNEKYVVSREKCVAGSIPIGDARFRVETTPATTIQELRAILRNIGVDDEHIIVQSLKAE